MEKQLWLMLAQSKSNIAGMTPNCMKNHRTMEKYGAIYIIKLQQCFCALQGQLSVAPQRLCFGLLHHHIAVYGSPLDTVGVQRRRKGLSPGLGHFSTAKTVIFSKQFLSVFDYQNT